MSSFQVEKKKHVDDDNIVENADDGLDLAASSKNQ